MDDDALKMTVLKARPPGKSVLFAMVKVNSLLSQGAGTEADVAEAIARLPKHVIEALLAIYESPESLGKRHREEFLRRDREKDAHFGSW